jgi:hypothetical protein
VFWLAANLAGTDHRLCLSVAPADRGDGDLQRIGVLEYFLQALLWNLTKRLQSADRRSD